LLLEDLGGESHRVLGSHRTIGPGFEDQAVEVGLATDASVGHPVVDLLDRREQAVDRDHADRHALGLVLIRRGITAPHGAAHLHAETTTLGECGDVLIGIENMHAGRALNVSGLDRALARRIEHERTGRGIVHRKAERLDVQDDVRDVFDDSGDRGELVERTVDPDRRDRRPLQRAQKHTAQAVPERETVASLEGLASELSVTRVEAARVDVQFLRTNEIPPVACNGVVILHADLLFPTWSTAR
jgi:hypothetical protein